MTLVATWYITDDEQQRQFNLMCVKVYGAEWRYMPVHRVDLMREEDGMDRHFVKAYYGSHRHYLVFVATELIKAGYFVL